MHSEETDKGGRDTRVLQYDRVGQLRASVRGHQISNSTPISMILAAGNSKVGAGALGIVVHEREDLFAPACHGGATAGGDDGFVAGVVGDLAQINARQLAVVHGAAQTGGDVGLFHEAEAQFDAGDAVAQWRSAAALIVGDAGGFGDADGDQQDLAVQAAVVLEILRERQRDSLGHAAEDDSGAWQAQRRNGLQLREEIFGPLAYLQAHQIHDLVRRFARSA